MDHLVIEHTDDVGWDILIRMELLTPLNQYINNKPLGSEGIVKLGIDICRALEMCQKDKILHRDIKPENIFVSKNGDFKLGDFGIARTAERTMAGLSKKGTSLYMAPEVHRSEPYGASADIYSLGIVLYRLLNDNLLPFLTKPITPSNKEEAFVKRLSGEALPRPVNADARLSEIVLRACAFKPGDRYESARQMRLALEGYLGEGSMYMTVPPFVNVEAPQESTSNERENTSHSEQTEAVFAGTDNQPVRNDENMTEGMFDDRPPKPEAGRAPQKEEKPAEQESSPESKRYFKAAKHGAAPVPLPDTKAKNPKQKRKIALIVATAVMIAAALLLYLVFIQISRRSKAAQYSDFIDAGCRHTVGLKADGTVAAAGSYKLVEPLKSWRDCCGSCGGVFSHRRLESRRHGCRGGQ